MNKYLTNSEIINWKHPSILALADELASGCLSTTEIAKGCYGWMRDKVGHSRDFRLNPVTCTASDLLSHRTVSNLASHGSTCYSQFI